MASIGSYYVRVLPDMSGFNGTLVQGMNTSMTTAGNNAGNVFSRTFLGFVSRVAIGTTIGRLVTSGFNTIVNGFSTGIERLDIIENYPNIMSNLGISNADAQRSVERLQEALLGLPTSLQSGVQSTTRLTTALGDIDRSTDAFIAFNNALVAGMAPASQQASALEQFSQAVAKGKPDMIEWRAMLAAMPGQMSQIAQSFGLTTDELGAALRGGDISMDEFRDHVIALNETGIGEFESFETQARGATATIGTALTNVGNRVAAGWAEIFKVFGQANIAEFIDNMATGILERFTAIADMLRWLKYTILGSGIIESLQTIGEQFSEIWENAFGSGPSIKDFLKGIIDAFAAFVGFIADTGLVDLVLPAIAGALVVIAQINIVPFIMGIVAAVQGLWAVLSANPLMVVFLLIEGLVTAIATWFTTTEEGRALWAEFTGWLSSTWERISTAFMGFVTEFAEGWSAGVATVVEWFTGVLIPFLGNLVSIIGSVVGFILTTVLNFIALIYNAVVTGIAAVIQFFVNLPGTLASIWETIVTTVGNVLYSIVSAFMDFVGQIAMVLAVVVGLIINYFADVAANVINIVSGLITGIVTFFAGLPDALASAWAALVDTVTTVWNNIISNTQVAWDGVRDRIRVNVDAVKTTVTNVFNSVKSFVTSIWNGIRSNITNAVTGIRTSVSTTFNNIKTAITTPINAAKDAVKTAVDKIKGFFNFSVSLPHIPLPHFGISPSGWVIGDLLKGVLPSLSISWYAKGGIINGATLYGVGEKGAELVWPSYEPYLSKYASAIADNMDGAVVNNYYIDGNEVAANAKLAAALETVAEYANTRTRMGAVARR